MVKLFPSIGLKKTENPPENLIEWRPIVGFYYNISYLAIPLEVPDSPSRCHLPFDRLMALSKSKGCVAFGRFSLRRITYTPQSALLGALHLTLCWCPGLSQKPLSLVHKREFDGRF